MTIQQKIGLGLFGVGIALLPIAYAFDIQVVNPIISKTKYHAPITADTGTITDSEQASMFETSSTHFLDHTPSAQPIAQGAQNSKLAANIQNNHAHHFAPNQSMSKNPMPHHAPQSAPMAQNADCAYYAGAAKVGIKHYKFPEASSAELEDFSGRRSKDQKIHKDAHQPLLDMMAAAEKDGVRLEVGSIFRSLDYQASIVNRKKKAGQSDAQIYKASSHPGYSEHHTGLAVDFTPISAAFDKTDQFKWLVSNAHKYDFYQTFTPEYSAKTGVMIESWHWKYMGTPRARDMLKNSSCLGKGKPG